MKKICLICNGGGHLEQMRQIMPITQKYSCFLVTMKDNSTLRMGLKTFYVSDYYRGKNPFIKIWRILKMFNQQMRIFLKEKPDAIISTGAAVSIPMCLIAKFFKKKTIYIESFARMENCNKTGKFLYKHVDLFIVQWKQLLKFYPKAQYWGMIY